MWTNWSCMKKNLWLIFQGAVMKKSYLVEKINNFWWFAHLFLIWLYQLHWCFLDAHSSYCSSWGKNVMILILRLTICWEGNFVKKWTSTCHLQVKRLKELVWYSGTFLSLLHLAELSFLFDFDYIEVINKLKILAFFVAWDIL